MDKNLLKKHISKYIRNTNSDKAAYEQDKKERSERSTYYKSWTPEKLNSMAEEQFYEFIAKLWAMLIWGNKKYVVDKLIEDLNKAVASPPEEAAGSSPEEKTES